jgi:hypothetical protein
MGARIMTRHRVLTLTATLTVAAVIGAGAAIAAGTTAPPPKTAFVANAYVPADALAAGPAAGRLGAPIFTTPQGSLSDAARAGLVDYGPDLVVVLGGTVAIANDVVTEISSATGLAVADIADTPATGIVRVAGQERTETAQKVADLFSAYDPMFLPADGKAHDADLLDGKDSTAFATIGGSGDVLSYDVELDSGAGEVPLAEIGPLTFSARCSYNAVGGHSATVRATSSEGPWYTGTAHHDAGDTVVVFDQFTTDSDPTNHWSWSWDADLAVPGTGVFLVVNGDEHGVWVGFPEDGSATCAFAGTFFPHIR